MSKPKIVSDDVQEKLEEQLEQEILGDEAPGEGDPAPEDIEGDGDPSMDPINPFPVDTVDAE